MKPYLMGPCTCQGCGEEVVWYAEEERRGWLHASGLLGCTRLGRPRLSDTPQRAYWRAIKARRRALAA